VGEKLESTEESIAKFLMDFKKLITTKHFLWVQRIEKNKSIVELGLNRKAVESELLSLSVTNYCSGPHPDKDLSKPGMVWKFGTEIDGYDVYIKLKIAEFNGGKLAVCISFHKAEFPLRFPYREQE
jgi:hypothetical protein